MGRRHTFERTCEIAAPAQRVWEFHEAPDALARLTPPWEHTEVIEPPRSLVKGTRVRMRGRVLGLWLPIEAVHVAYDPPRMFADEMVRGPFAYWHHDHIVEPIDEGRCRLVDRIEYELPLGLVGDLAGKPIAERRLDRMFAYRHRVTREACERP